MYKNLAIYLQPKNNNNPYILLTIYTAIVYFTKKN